MPEPLTFDEPLVRCGLTRTESSTGFGRYSGATQHIPVKLNGKVAIVTGAASGIATRSRNALPRKERRW